MADAVIGRSYVIGAMNEQEVKLVSYAAIDAIGANCTGAGYVADTTTLNFYFLPATYIPAYDVILDAIVANLNSLTVVSVAGVPIITYTVNGTLAGQTYELVLINHEDGRFPATFVATTVVAAGPSFVQSFAYNPDASYTLYVWRASSPYNSGYEYRAAVPGAGGGAGGGLGYAVINSWRGVFPAATLVTNSVAWVQVINPEWVFTVNTNGNPVHYSFFARVERVQNGGGRVCFRIEVDGNPLTARPEGQVSAAIPNGDDEVVSFSGFVPGLAPGPHVFQVVWRTTDNRNHQIDGTLTQPEFCVWEVF